MTVLKFIIFIGLVLSCVHKKNDPISNIKVIGGQEIASADDAYFLAALGDFNDTNEFSQFCGSTLIAPHIAITAAHCVARTPYLKPLYVTSYAIDLSAPEEDITYQKVLGIIKHENYNDRTLENDIAILILAVNDKNGNDIDFSNRKFAVLPGENRLNHAKKFTVAGWGNLTSSGWISTDIAHHLEVDLLSMDECKESYFYDDENGNRVDEIFPGMFCSGSEGRDTCQGDSGGPVVYKLNSDVHELVGIVSWGYGCAQNGNPGVYTDVGHFKNWINSRIAELNKFWEYKDLSAQMMNNFCYDRFKMEQEINDEEGNEYRHQQAIKIEDQFSEYLGGRKFDAESKICEFEIMKSKQKFAVIDQGSDLLLHHFNSDKIWKSKKKLENSFIHYACQAAEDVSYQVWLNFDREGFYINVGDSWYRAEKADSFSKEELVNARANSCQSVVENLGKAEINWHIDEETGKPGYFMYNNFGIPHFFKVLPGEELGGEGSFKDSIYAQLQYRDGTNPNFIIYNNTYDKIFTWELVCSKKFSLMHNGSRITPSAMQTDDMEEYVFRFNWPNDGDLAAIGALGGFVNFEVINLDLPLRENGHVDLSLCQLNGGALPVEFKKLNPF